MRVGRPALLGLVAALMALAVAGVTVATARRPAAQPIAFNHRLHVEQVELACTDCHLHATSGARATIPNVTVCGDCHAEALTDSPEEARVVAHVKAGTPIPWRKVYWVPDHVFFSHRRHTAIAGIECATCHGGVAQREVPLTRRLVPVTMDRCMECHARTGASNDCILCHR